MTHNNLYMEDDDLKLYVDVQPTYIDELENSKNAAASSAEQARQSEENARTWKENIIAYKTNLELFYAQASNSLTNLLNSSVEEMTNAKNSALEYIQSFGNTVCNNINNIIQSFRTEGQSIINQAQNYANQAMEALDNNVSEDYLIESNAMESGNISGISNVLKKIKNYAHSTFCGYQANNASPLDPKKFIKVGNPSITTNGIAGRFSSGNYLTLGQTFNLSSDFILKIGNIDFSNRSASTGIFRIVGSNGAYINLNQNWTTLLMYMDDGSGSENYQTNATGINSPYKIVVSKSGTSLTIDTFSNNEKVMTKDIDASSFDFSKFTNCTIDIGAGAWGGAEISDIDLKQFSITVDGVEVFSGNKTGMDTVKADDYTEVNNPTISDDGILSNTSANDYLMIPEVISLGSANNWEIQVKWNTGSTVSLTDWGIINYRVTGTDFTTPVFGGNQDGLACLASSDGSTWNLIVKTGLLTPVANTSYYFKYGFTGTQYYLKYNTTGWDNGFTDLFTQDSTTKVYCVENFIIGHKGLAGSSIDLNSIKIYVDGDLVYQPCLKIPYTESSTGSKVANAIYRSRVKDAYEQGYLDYSYYTLDEDNGNFTLPMGEIYGMIENIKKLLAAQAS